MRAAYIASITRICDFFKPRLGKLHQYKPRPITVIKPQVEASKQHLNINQLPKISIITPSFEQGIYLERTILSILEQEYPNLEYFIQDGGSKDNTISILKQYNNKLSGWASEPDSGQAQAINRAFAKTSGEIMAWINSDDLLMPGTLATVAEFFRQNPNVDVIYANRLLINSKDQEIGRWVLPGHSNKVLKWVDFIPQETLFWRRSIWEKIGGQIDESFCFAMDWDLLIRFKEASAKFTHIPQFFGAFRVHAEQKTSTVVRAQGFQEMDRIRERIHGRIPSRKQIHLAILPYVIKHIAVDIIYRLSTVARLPFY